VPEARLLKLNEAGFAKRRQLLEQQTKKNRPPGTASPVPSSVKGKEKGKKAESSKKRSREISTIENVSGPRGLSILADWPVGNGLPETARGEDCHSRFAEIAIGRRLGERDEE
jgi:hypothetical protein